MSTENDTNLFDDSEATILYSKVEDKNPLSEILDRMNGLSLAAISPKKQDTNIEDLTSEFSVNEDNIKTNKNEDVVYLQCFVDTIRNLQKKLNKIIKNKFVHKQSLNEIYEKINQGDNEGVKKSLELILEKKTKSFLNQNAIQNFTKNTFPMLYKKILGNLENLKNLQIEISELNKNVLENYYEKKEDIKKIENIIKQFKLETESFIKFSDNENIDMFFFTLINKFKELNKEIQNYKQENKKLKENTEIEELKKQLEEKKLTIKQLQSQNVSFSEVITKLDGTNIKLKKECVILGTEYKKVIDSLKFKNTIIEKQKKILEVLQTQVGSKKDFPIEDLKKKIIKIKNKIEKENNQEIIFKLQKEKSDYEKRIKDYEIIHK